MQHREELATAQQHVDSTFQEAKRHKHVPPDVIALFERRLDEAEDDDTRNDIRLLISS